MKTVKIDQDKFPLRCVHHVLVPVFPYTVKSGLPVLLLACPSLSQEKSL